MEQTFKQFAMARRWPEAIVVCPQGLNTPGTLSDLEGKKSGWQNQPGLQNDRDLQFFDALLASIKGDYQVDDKRIYASGHSNGAGFTYVLWAVRCDNFAAFAPITGAIRPEIQALLKPKPALIVAGETDKIVKFEWQSASIDFVRKLNECGDGVVSHSYLHAYPSSIQSPLEAYIHPGNHGYPPESVDAIVKFFHLQVKP